MRHAAWLLVILLPATAPQAAPLPDDDSLLQPRASRPDRLAGVGGASSAASALDRALMVETSPVQRSLDLLLETRGSAGAIVDPQARRRTQTPLSVATTLPNAAEPAAPSALPASANAQQRLLALATEAGLTLSASNPFQGRAPAGDASADRREWMGAVGAVGSGPTLLEGSRRLAVVEGGESGRPPVRESVYDSPVFSGLQDLVATLREHRFWVLGAAALFGLGVVLVRGMQQLLRRQSQSRPGRAQPSTTVGDLAPPVAHRHRRRSSRRL